jgi:hypothetical protein
MNKSEDLNYIDRFLYKLLIGTILLLIFVFLDKIKVISLEDVQRPLSEHINVLPALELLNGKEGKILPIEITDQVSSTTYQVYYNAQIITNGRLVLINEFQGVENYKAGVIVKIYKNNDNSYEVTVKGLDNFLYVYDHLETVDLNIYKYVKSGEIIGLPANKDGKTFYRFYIYHQGKPVHLLP